MISSTGTPVFTRVLASVSAKMPHLLLTLWRLMPSYGMSASRSLGTCSLRAVFSTKVPVPPLHADCMKTCLDLATSVPAGPAPVAVKKMVFMSSPPISETKRTSGCSFSTHAATATTSWTSLPPASGARNPAPEPVKKMRSRPAAMPPSRSIRSRNSSTFSAWRVLWRW